MTDVMEDVPAKVAAIERLYTAMQCMHTKDPLSALENEFPNAEDRMQAVAFIKLMCADAAPTPKHLENLHPKLRVLRSVGQHADPKWEIAVLHDKKGWLISKLAHQFIGDKNPSMYETYADSEAMNTMGMAMHKAEQERGLMGPSLMCMGEENIMDVKICAVVEASHLSQNGWCSTITKADKHGDATSNRVAKDFERAMQQMEYLPAPDTDDMFDAAKDGENLVNYIQANKDKTIEKRKDDLHTKCGLFQFYARCPTATMLQILQNKEAKATLATLSKPNAEDVAVSMGACSLDGGKCKQTRPVGSTRARRSLVDEGMPNGSRLVRGAR